jgi:hypothetical protein
VTSLSRFWGRKPWCWVVRSVRTLGKPRNASMRLWSIWPLSTHGQQSILILKSNTSAEKRQFHHDRPAADLLRSLISNQAFTHALYRWSFEAYPVPRAKEAQRRHTGQGWPYTYTQYLDGSVKALRALLGRHPPLEGHLWPGERSNQAVELIAYRP